MQAIPGPFDQAFLDDLPYDPNRVLLFDRLYAPAELAAEVDAVTPADVARLGGRLLSGKAATAVLGAKSALKAGEAFDKALFQAA